MLREVTQQRELDRLKDEFVATVSHELRTPLTSMMGFLEMIREEEAGQLTDEQKRFLAIVYRSSERLQRLVGDLLFVARLDAAGLQLHHADVDVDEVVRECIESVGALARSRKVELRSELGEVPSVWADRERLAQLVWNLVSNAIKFTPAGGAVTARTFVDGEDVAIQVEDTGIGIPKLEQDRLFQRFFRSSTATAAGDSRHRARARHLEGDRRGAPRPHRRALGRRRRDVLHRAPAVRPEGSRRVTRIVSLDVGSSSVRAVAYDEDGIEQPGAAHYAYASLDADELVAACRGVLAQVGEGDVLAISCFWHSLLPLDGHGRPASHLLTWRDRVGEEPALDPVDYHRRTGCFLHPSFWPAKLGTVRAARYLSFPDYLLLELTGELRTSIVDGERHGPLRPEPAVPGTRRRSPRAASSVDQLAPVSDEPVHGVWPALGDGACSNVGVGLRVARAGGGHGRHVRGDARRVRRGVGRGAAGALSLPRSTSAASAWAVRFRTAATCTPGSPRRCASRTASRRPRTG